VIGVVKAYTTRVGNGPFPTELSDEIGNKLREIGGEYGATTGRPRRCGWFDAPVVRKAAAVNGLTHLAITKLDVLDTFKEIKICTSYKLEGKDLLFFPNRLAQVSLCEPIYETVPGWECSTANCRSWSDLPPNAQKYLTRISELADVKIGIISIGAKRDESIVLDIDD
jgi:adenylosuccinate synthase